MNSRIVVGLAILSLIFFVVFFGVAAAQAEEELQPGVARVSLIHGDMSMQRGDSGDWIAGSINAPVVAGDHISSGVRSRTEVQLDYANILRLADNTEVKIADLTRTHAQVQVRLGLVDFTVLKGSEADVEIDTSNVAIRPLKQGQYRIEVRSEGDSSLIVRDGEAEVTTPQGSTTVHKGDMISIRGRDNPEYQVSNAPRKDDWDNWNKERDHQIWDAASWSHANRYYTGVNDLDAYGHWVYVPGYDRCWFPAVAAGWAPYGFGRWVWEPYWGWTWVSYEPWGWAPYHYGRWFLWGSRWAWWPGPVFGGFRPVWAPAYVSFFGFGHHFGVSVGFGFGSIGWFPIGPSDHFFPWWGRHGRTVNIVNVTNITNITNIRNVNGWAPLGGNRPQMSNLRGVLDNPRQHGFWSMPADDFGRGAVPRNHEIPNRVEMRQASLVAGTVPVVPTRDSLRVSDRQVASLPPHANQPERFFTKSEPKFRPEPFHAGVARVQETLGERPADVRVNRPGATPALRDDPSAPNNRRAGGPGQEMPNTPARNEALNNVRPEMRNEGRNRELANDRPETRRDAAAPGSSGMREEPRPETRAPESSGPRWRRFGEDRAALNAEPQAQQPAREQPRGEQPRAQSPQQNQPAPRSSESAPGTPGWRRFSDRDRPQTRENAPAPRAPAAETPRSIAPPRQGENQSDHSGWQRFERPAQPRSMETPRAESPGMNRTYTPSAPPAVQREMPRSMPRTMPREAPRAVERPPLRMERPIVTPRAPAAAQGGSRPARSGGEGRGASRPSSTREAPRNPK